MIKNLILIALIYILYRIAKAWIIENMKIGQDGAVSKSKQNENADDVMIKDPQCGVYFPQRDAVTLKHGGQTLYFCSEKCRDEYKHK